MFSDLEIKTVADGVLIRCDSETASALCAALLSLAPLVRAARNKLRGLEIEREIAEEQERARAMIAYRDTAKLVYGAFCEAQRQANSREGRQAVRVVAKGLKMSVCDVKGYVAEGKRIAKKEGARIVGGRSAPGE